MSAVDNLRFAVESLEQGGGSLTFTVATGREILAEIERLHHDLEDESRRFQEARTDADVAAGLLAEARTEIERLRAIEALNVGAIDASLVRLGAVTGAIGPMPADPVRERFMRGAVSAVVIDGADPLAALEAAERRLLERQGWEARPFNMWLRRSAGGVQQTTQENAVQIERRRLAAKGGA